jgi:hypothetical protein
MGELLERTLLHYPTMLQHTNAIGIANSTEAMSHHNASDVEPL